MILPSVLVKYSRGEPCNFSASLSEPPRRLTSGTILLSNKDKLLDKDLTLLKSASNSALLSFGSRPSTAKYI